MIEEWVVGIKEKCLQANVPFFFKQWGGVRKKKAGRELQGMTWDQMPRVVLHQSAVQAAFT
jgi:protein gp37